MGLRMWNMPECDSAETDRLVEETGFSPICCSVLCARGYRDAGLVKQVFSLTGPLPDPNELADMDKAVSAVRGALEQEERICVFGDYDCDGITATALLVSYLQSVGADVIYYIPDREREGYGLTCSAMDFLKEEHVSLVVTVDNGISAHEEVLYASSLGMQTVVTDHHTPRETLPDAVAVVNPHRTDCSGGFRHLAGVGVAFLLVCALEEAEPQELLEYYSDLVMLGTIADVVELTGPNRIMAAHGLRRLCDTERPGLMALMETGGLEPDKISSTSMAFGLIPRINAAGRMGSADDAVELLLTDDARYAMELAGELENCNLQRKQEEARVITEIEALLQAQPDLLQQDILMVEGENWHHGVTGIVASRLCEQYEKPVIVFSVNDGEARGSGRSVEGFSLIRAIADCSDFLLRYGGHDMAAGLTLSSKKLPALRGAMQTVAEQHRAERVLPSLMIDCELSPERVILEELINLDQLQPWGAGNAKPQILLRNMKILDVFPIGGAKHLRIRLGSGGATVQALYFRMTADRFPYGGGDQVDVVVNLEQDGYRKKDVSVIIRDIRLSGADQEGLMEGMRQYHRFDNNEMTDHELENLCPDRADFALVYRFLKKKGGFRYGPEELWLRLAGSGIGYGRLRVLLDVLEEMKLITVTGRQIALSPVAEKADLNNSKILAGFRRKTEVTV